MDSASARAELDHAAEALQRALDKGDTAAPLVEVFARVRDGDAQLWLADGGRTAAVTEAVTCLEVWLFGGGLSFMPELEARAVAYAEANGFDAIAVTDARKGWGRLLQPMGYRRQVVTDDNSVITRWIKALG